MSIAKLTFLRVTLSRGFSRTASKLGKDNSEKEFPVSNGAEPYITAHEQPEKGKIYDNKPFKVLCEKGKKYQWCTCGHSHTQPFCDGTHKSPFLKIKLKPVRFVPTETKEYWFCNCKQTNKRPFCDGTHRKEEVTANFKA